MLWRSQPVLQRLRCREQVGVTTDSAGHREWTRRRESCCFSYLLTAESECDACPRTCPKS